MIWSFKKKGIIPVQSEYSDAWPEFVDSKSAIACWMHPDRRQRVFLIKRQDGAFSKWSEYFRDDEFEMCWMQDDSGGSFYDSEETATQEIYGAYPWSRGVEPERRIPEKKD